MEEMETCACPSATHSEAAEKLIQDFFNKAEMSFKNSKPLWNLKIYYIFLFKGKIWG